MKKQNPDKFQISLKVLLTNDQGENLILKDISKSKNWKNKYDLPGGRINKKEIGVDFHQLIDREIQEEIGQKVKYKLRPDPVAISKCHYPNEPSKFFVLFEAKYLSGQIKFSQEHSGYKWIKLTRKNVKKLFSSVLAKLILNYLRWNKK